MVMMMTPGPTFARMRARIPLLFVTTSVALFGCGGDSTAPVDRTPASVAAVTTVSATGQAGAQASAAPTVVVKTASGTPVQGVAVTFVVSGGGTIGSTAATTDSNGQASAGPWTLGPQVGANTVTATVGALAPVTFSVTTSAGAPATVLAASGNVTSAIIGQTITPAVRVADQFDNPVANVAVTFSTLSGSVAGATVNTDANGIARIGSWNVGTVAGALSLTATAGSATGTIIIPVSAGLVISKALGGTATCAVNTKACSFKVHVQNALGAAVGGEVVQWSGNGQTLNTTTDASGDATATNVVAQTLAGTFTQVATLQSTGQAVSFAYTVTASFDIEVVFISAVSNAQRAAFTAAAERWETVITGDIPGFNITAADGITAGYCGINHPAVVRNIDDLLIYVDLTPLDGVGNLLGQAGPCIYNTSNNKPIIGTMQFDAADLDAMLANGTLQAVITHEMGHVLGIGSMWDTGFLLTGAGGTDPFFSGVNAIDYFKRAGGTVALGNGVPVENCLVGVPSSCGQGTRDSHWRESIFKTELMTGYISGTSNPLSAVTIAALADQGYDVNFAAADAYSLPTASGNIAMDAEGASSLFELSQRVELRERATPKPRPFPRSR
jgi:hypothetical protein